MRNGPDPRASSGLGVLDAWRSITAPVPGQPATRYTGVVVVLGLLNAGALAGAGAAAIPDPFWAAAFGLVHTAIVPGALLAMILLPTDELDLAEWLVLAAGLGLAALVLSGLVLALLPVRLGAVTVVGWSATLALLLSGLAFKRGLSWQAPAVDRAALTDAGLVALGAALTRLPGLGYSELQGDETEVVLRAAGVVQALPDAIFYHGKGPGEVVTVAMLYGLVGALSEGAARLPFALAGILGIVAVSLVARRLLGRAAGLAAGALLCANGYFVAFSRISQYQTLVLLLGTLALWAAVRWSAGGGRIWPVLAGTFAATAALAHYDALFVLPPLALVVLWRTGRRGLADRETMLPWLAGAGVGLAVLALFFGPYLASPLFGLATGRIGDRVGAGFPYNNLPSILASGTLYLGTVYPLLVGALGLGGLLALPRHRPGPSTRVWLLGLLWSAVPFAFYAFVARKPGTHVHVATTGLVLLAAVGAAAIWGAIGQAPARRITLAVALAACLGLVGAYLVPVYLLTTAEVVRENRVARLPFAWTPPGGLPAKERFGFPYQAGWKAVGALYADGTLRGSYESNEQPQVTHWYTRGTWRCSADPRYYLIAENVQDEIETPRRTIQSAYHQIGTVTVAGEPKLRLYERGPAPADAARPTTWAAEDLAGRFDRVLSRPSFDPGVWARGVVARDGVARPARFGDALDLLGYQVYAEEPAPGGVVRVDLFWHPRVTSEQGHRIDVQLGTSPRIGDGGGPACDKTGAEQEWQAGQPFVQRVSIPVAASAAPGAYPLLVGVSRQGDGGGPLTPAGPDTAAGSGPLLEIGQVEIREGSRAAR